MLENTNPIQFSIVIRLLDNYLIQKLQNTLLNSWIALKKNKKNNRHKFSNASFAKPNLEAVNSIVNVITKQLKTKGKTTRHQTVGNQDQIPHKYFSKKAQIFPKTSRANKVDFEDMILAKLDRLQQNFQRVKSQSSSIRNDQTLSSKRERRNIRQNQEQLGLKFTLNTKYIPMRQRLQNLHSFVKQQENYHIQVSNSDQFEQQLRLVAETPRIGSRRILQANNDILLEGIQIIGESRKNSHQIESPNFKYPQEQQSTQNSMLNKRESYSQIYSLKNSEVLKYNDLSGSMRNVHANSSDNQINSYQSMRYKFLPHATYKDKTINFLSDKNLTKFQRQKKQNVYY